jgi:hypothetical protein
MQDLQHEDNEQARASTVELEIAAAAQKLNASAATCCP